MEKLFFPFQYGPRYDWSNSQQTLVLSAYFYGYMSTLLLGGLLNQIFGPRAIVGTCIGLNAIATAFVPLAAELSFWAVFSVRVFIGAMAVWCSIYNTFQVKFNSILITKRIGYHISRFKPNNSTMGTSTREGKLITSIK